MSNYVNNPGFVAGTCPYCGAGMNHLQFDKQEETAEEILYEVECTVCNCYFQETFTLTNILVDDDDMEMVRKEMEENNNATGG